MATGTLRIQSFAARQSAPVPGVTVVVTGADFIANLLTDSEGNATDLSIEAPACSYSLDENNTTVLPYSTCSLVATKEGYRPVTIEGIQIFAGQVTLAELEMLPADEASARIADEPVVIPMHALFAGTGGSGPAPVEDCTAARVLDKVIVPKNITVHLGKPSASAQNVTVSFRDYIANVASSEVYPTWPEQALRANIHCQISLALNRIYTEWYPSKGYSFNITNSTSYDQYYVHGRTVFDVMVRLTDDIFNTYVRKTGTVNPYYTEYCDGKSVSCPGLKQWGTVTLAESGKNALQILKNYYGNDIEIVRTTNIQSIPESYPGSPVRQGDTGTSVYTLQRQLNRITKDYPSFGLLTVDGIFGPAMTATVKKFQKQFNLTADGVVGRQTWYKISYIYVSVKDLAELTSEGETASGTLSDGTWGGTTLRVGSSGSAVEQVQFWLNVLAQYYASIPSVSVDGVYGSGTQAAVRAFQQRFGLTVDGVVGQTTWNAIYAQYRSIQSDNGTPNAYPGTALQQGDTGANVKLIQFWLKIARSNYSSLNDVTVDGIFGAATTAAVKKFQSYFGLTSDGIVGRATWNKLHEVYTDIANDLLTPSLRPGEFPGTLKLGSTGTAVRELQYYLYLMSAYESSIPAVTIDGVFGAATEAAVRAYQRFAGLTVDGIVGQTTWNSLYSKASVLRLSGPVVTVERMAYPGTPLTIGSSGSAVTYYTLLLSRIAYYFDAVEDPGTTDTYTERTAEATKSFQTLLGLPATGTVDLDTWNAAELLGVSLLADASDPDATVAATQEQALLYPGRAVCETSASPQVLQVQQWLNRIGTQFCTASFVEEDRSFGPEETAKVQDLQQMADLDATGTVDEATWAVLRAAADGVLPTAATGAALTARELAACGGRG
jgi:peptidoglycan hydrolase-like protein with peptidoglycan-binding domain